MRTRTGRPLLHAALVLLLLVRFLTAAADPHAAPAASPAPALPWQTICHDADPSTPNPDPQQPSCPSCCTFCCGSVHGHAWGPPPASPESAPPPSPAGGTYGTTTAVLPAAAPHLLPTPPRGPPLSS